MLTSHRLRTAAARAHPGRAAAVHRALRSAAHGGCIAGFALLGGCGAGSYSSSFGTTSVAASTSSGRAGSTAAPGFNSPTVLGGTHDMVIATASSDSVAVAVGAAQTVSVTFASSDARAMTGFSISGAAGGLPPGWSAPSGFACTTLATGSGCVLNLLYAPTAPGSGTLALSYVVIDNAGIAQTDGALSVAYRATITDHVIATATPTGEVDAVTGGGAAPVNVNFVTDDGNPATNFSVTTDLGALPAGWSAGVAALACAIVSTGSGCDLGLRYSATPGGSGVLTLTYAYTDDSGTSQTGSVNIPYRPITTNAVIANASPAGEIVAVQKTGGQAVPITFTTNDGKPASQLKVLSNLAQLPAGWTSASPNFSCASVSMGNGCQLALRYAPVALASGTLSLDYSFVDGTGTARSGLLNVAYAATTNDNVVGTPSPAGQINAVVGSGSQAVAVTFTTDDGRPATALTLGTDLATLPPGWSSTATTFNCGALDVDTPCTLPLTYAPAAAGNGTLTLGFTYVNNAGQPKTGTAAIAYRATTHYLYVANSSSTDLSVCAIDGMSLAPCSTTADGVTAPAGITVNGTSAYVSYPAANSVSQCILDAGGALTGCAPTGGTFTYPTAVMFDPAGPFAYVSQSTGPSVCAVGGAGQLSACLATGTAYLPLAGLALSSDGSHAYAVHGATVIDVCSIAIDGTFGTCSAAGGNAAQALSALAVYRGNLYLSTSVGSLDACAVNADATLGNCQTTATGSNADGLAFLNGTAWLSTNGATVLACPVNVDGTFGACVAASDPTFNGTAGVYVQ